jgi:hypothetical protein
MIMKSGGNFENRMTLCVGIGDHGFPQPSFGYFGLDDLHLALFEMREAKYPITVRSNGGIRAS